MATKKKGFTTPTAAFISSMPQEETAPEPTIKVPGFTVPEGYRLVRESKSKRLQLLVTPTIAANLRAAAAVEDISLNELCNRIFEEYLKGGK